MFLCVSHMPTVSAAGEEKCKKTNMFTAATEHLVSLFPVADEDSALYKLKHTAQS